MYSTKALAVYLLGKLMPTTATFSTRCIPVWDTLRALQAARPALAVHLARVLAVRPLVLVVLAALLVLAVRPLAVLQVRAAALAQVVLPAAQPGIAVRLMSIPTSREQTGLVTQVTPLAET